MGLKTYYWEKPLISKIQIFKNKILGRRNQGFAYGNAGDIFNKDLIQYLYNQKPINIRNQESKLLLVGSIASVINNNDVLCGIGWKGNDLSDIKEHIKTATVYGLRGPLTKKLFEDYGTDLSTLKFMLDPGLLIKEVYNLKYKKYSGEKIIFIPHYKDENFYKNNYPNPIKFVSIDNHPKKIAKEIMKSKVVYTSSLHGIIFSHALNTPCVFVSPQSEEPIFKYEDYFKSIDQEMPKPLKTIYEFNLDTDIRTQLKKPITINDFYFPSRDELISKGIIV
jgi:pyruvyltransferase